METTIGDLVTDAFRATASALDGPVDVAIVSNGEIRTSIAKGATGYLLKSTRRGELLAAIDLIMHGGSPMSSGIARKVVQSFAKVPTAILSRATAGTRGRTLIVNLPGNPRAIGECLPLLLPAIREALRHLRGEA